MVLFKSYTMWCLDPSSLPLKIKVVNRIRGMRITLEIDDFLYSKAEEMKIDIRTFLELKLYEYITGRESLANSKPLRYTWQTNHLKQRGNPSKPL